MQRVFLFIFSFLLAPPLWAQSFYAGTDLGTSHSDRGLGVYTGINWKDLSAEIGYGLHSKKNLLGRPWSLALAWRLPDFYFKAGASYYKGSGNRRVLFEDDSDYNVQARWNILYTRIGAGFMKELYKDVNAGLEAGSARVSAGSVDYESKSDQTNLSHPRGIVVDDFYFYKRPTYAGPGEIGLIYMRVFIQYKFGE
jgi:hypothetical protein